MATSRQRKHFIEILLGPSQLLIYLRPPSCRALPLRRTQLPQCRRLVSTSSHQDRLTTLQADILFGDEPPAATRATRNTFKESNPVISRHVKLELQRLNDPFVVAKRVEQLLTERDPEKALVLARTASASMECVVSWNLLIDYYMSQQRLHAAIKLLTEMKKRGQKPNMQTYTIIFSRCAKSDHKILAVSEATRLYFRLLSDNRLTPNTIHLNSVLNACGRALDIETMFSVLETADDSSRRPDSITYTTILNALRARSDLDFKQRVIPEAQHRTNNDAIVRRAKEIWDDIMKQWRKGALVVDGYLVMSMCRILLLGSTQNKGEVMTVLKETMKIPDLSKDPLPLVSPPASEANLEVPNRGTLSATHTRSRPNSSLAPGNQTLSLVLQTLLVSRKLKLITKYWTLFTSHYKVNPDRDNWYRLFMAFKLAHNSGLFSSMIKGMPDEFMDTKIFQLGMETCLRDTHNASVHGYAASIFDTCIKSVPQPPPTLLKEFINLSLVGLRKNTNEGWKSIPFDAQRCNRIWDTLQRVLPPFRAHASVLDPLIAKKKGEVEAERAAWERDKAKRGKARADGEPTRSPHSPRLTASDFDERSRGDSPASSRQREEERIVKSVAAAPASEAIIQGAVKDEFEFMHNTAEWDPVGQADDESVGQADRDTVGHADGDSADLTEDSMRHRGDPAWERRDVKLRAVQSEVISLARKLIAGMDTVLQSRILNMTNTRAVQQAKSDINRYITYFFSNSDRHSLEDAKFPTTTRTVKSDGSLPYRRRPKADEGGETVSKEEKNTPFKTAARTAGRKAVGKYTREKYVKQTVTSTPMTARAAIIDV